MALPIPYCMGPKYRLKILDGKVADEVKNCVRAFAES